MIRINKIKITGKKRNVYFGYRFIIAARINLGLLISSRLINIEGNKVYVYHNDFKIIK